VIYAHLLKKENSQNAKKCEKFACKFCIPSVLVEKICVMCVRNSIREEIITENLEKCKNLEETLSELKKIRKIHSAWHRSLRRHTF
jgi:hypothetical protein